MPTEPLRLTERQSDVLDSLRVLGRFAWWRPMDFGGYDGSHHSQTATALVRKGLAERKRFAYGLSSGHWRYRITEKGREASLRQEGIDDA